MEIERLREFLTLVSEKSFTSAATKLFITQSSLSRHISSLEEDLGAQLFERNSRSITLTPAGETAVEYAERIVTTYDELVNEVSGSQDCAPRILQVGILSRSTDDVVEPLLNAFPPGNSAIQLKLSAVDGFESIERLMADELDVALVARVHFPREDDLRFHRMYRDPLVLMMPDTDPLAERDTVSMRELDGRILAYPSKGNDYKDQINSLLAACGSYPSKTISVDDELSLPHILRDNDALSIVSKNYMKAPPAGIRFAAIEEDFALDMCWAYKISNVNTTVLSFVKTATRVVQSSLQPNS